MSFDSSARFDQSTRHTTDSYFPSSSFTSPPTSPPPQPPPTDSSSYTPYSPPPSSSPQNPQNENQALPFSAQMGALQNLGSQGYNNDNLLNLKPDDQLSTQIFN